jgi:hypothetical protein
MVYTDGTEVFVCGKAVTIFQSKTGIPVKGKINTEVIRVRAYVCVCYFV